MTSRWVVLRLAIVCVSVIWSLPASAGINVMEKGDSYLDMGMLIEVQGRAVQNPNANTGIEDGVFFRRLRPFLYGAMTKNWQGVIQLDFGNGFEGRMQKHRSSGRTWSTWGWKPTGRPR